MGQADGNSAGASSPLLTRSDRSALRAALTGAVEEQPHPLDNTGALLLKMQNRIDHKKLAELRKASIPFPIHAINYIQLRNSRYYRLYGLLLVPYAIPKGVRPVWVGLHEDNILGKENDDEIVILEYPNHDTLIDIFISKY